MGNWVMSNRQYIELYFSLLLVTYYSLPFAFVNFENGRLIYLQNLRRHLEWL
jgi:hypothetical protein